MTLQLRSFTCVDKNIYIIYWPEFFIKTNELEGIFWFLKGCKHGIYSSPLHTSTILQIDSIILIEYVHERNN